MRRFLGFLAAIVLSPVVFALDPPRPVLLLDRSDHPWAAWVERQGAVTVGRVAQWDGEAWKPVGGPLNRDPQESVATVSLTFGPYGTPWAAWGERPLDLTGVDVGLGLLHVARWTGGTWAEVGPSPNRSTRTVAERPELRIDSQGRPWVQWSEITPDFNVDNVYLAVLDAGGWSVIDNGTLTTDVSSSSRSREFALGPGDKPFLTFSQMVYRHDFQVFAGGWNGTQWDRTGGPLNLDPDAYAAFPSLVLDASGVPTVAYLQASDGFKLVVKRWTGSTWQLLGTPGSLGARNPKVALAGTSTVLAATEPMVGVTVRVRTNAGWVDLGPGISTPGAFVDTLDLAVDSQANPWVLWAEDDAQGQRLGLARWTGVRWEGLTPPPFHPVP
jgi:hypothetical protein